MDVQASKWPKPQETCRKIHHKSDCSDSEDGKDDQARSNPVDIKNPQPSTYYARDSALIKMT